MAYFNAVSQHLLGKTERYLSKHLADSKTKKTKLNSMAIVRKRTIPTERPPLVSEINAKLCG
jgi:hypothetical protein